MNTTPTEYDECVVLAEYLEIKGLKYSHIPNETFTKSWGTKMKNKRQGVKRGVPDYMIIVKSVLIFIEMKRKKGGRTSKEQKEWMEALNKCDCVSAYVCEGADEAIEVINKYL